MAMTKSTNLINPEVIADYIDAKLVDKIQLSGLMTVDKTLEGQAGDTLSFPQFVYIGDAEDMTEGDALETAVLSATETKVTVKQIGKAVEISDKALLSAHGDVVGESTDQILLSMANKIEKEAFTALEEATLVHDHTGAVESDIIADAVVKFGEDLDEEIFCFINPKHYAQIRKSNFIAGNATNIQIGGVVGEVYGVHIVLSNRVPENRMFILKRDALGLVLKRNAEVETERDILKKSTIISGDKHYVCYLRNQARAIKVNLA